MRAFSQEEIERLRDDLEFLTGKLLENSMQYDHQRGEKVAVVIVHGGEYGCNRIRSEAEKLSIALQRTPVVTVYTDRTITRQFGSRVPNLREIDRCGYCNAETYREDEAINGMLPLRGETGCPFCRGEMPHRPEQ